MRLMGIREILSIGANMLSGGAEDLSKIRQKLVDIGLLFLVSCTTIGLIFGIIISFRIGFAARYTFHFIVWLVLALALHLRHSIPYALKTIVFLGMFLVLAGLSIWIYGVSGMAPLMLTAFAILSGVLYGMRGCWIAIAINTVLAIGAIFAAAKGVSPASSSNATILQSWIMNLVWVNLISLLVTIISEALQKGLLASRKVIATHADEIAEAHSALEQEMEERKRAEEQRNEIQQQLHQSEKMRAIGQLAGGVAHDFNNQLTGIIAAAQALQIDLGNNEEQSDLAKGIFTAGKRAADLTKQLLAFAREKSAISKYVDVHELILEALELLKRSIDKRIGISSEFSARLSHTLGDPSQLQNAILNLALNACDAMPEGGQLSVRTTQEEVSEEALQELGLEKGIYIIIEVQDTGTGMNEQVMSNIFEPFFTTKPPGKGTGMGLAAVYGTIKSHKGIIDVQSQMGKGTSFQVFLPAFAPPIAETNSKKDDRIPKGEGTILVIDDEHVVRFSAQTLLERIGYTTVLCENGEEGIRVYKENQGNIRAVLLDMVMPGLQGNEVFDRLREINPKVCVVITSGYNKEGDGKDSVRIRANAYLQKPFGLRDLAKTLATALEKSSL